MKLLSSPLVLALAATGVLSQCQQMKTPEKCLTSNDASEIVGNFSYLLANPSATDYAQRAGNLFTANVNDTSGSVNFMMAAQNGTASSNAGESVSKAP